MYNKILAETTQVLKIWKDLKASVNNTGFILSHFIILLVPEKNEKQVIVFFFKILTEFKLNYKTVQS